MAFVHILRGASLSLSPNEGVGITCDKQKTVTFNIPNSASLNSTWFSYGVAISYVASTEIPGWNGNAPVGGGTADVNGYQTAFFYTYAAPSPSAVFSAVISQYYNGAVSGGPSYYRPVLTLQPHCVPQVSGKSNYQVCRGHTLDIAWSVFDASAVSVVDSAGNTVPVTINAVVTTPQLSKIAVLPTEWQWNDIGGASAVVSIYLTPTVETTYTITVVGYGGEVTTSSSTFTFIPFSVSLSAAPITVQAPAPVTLTWASVGAIAVDLYYAVPNAGGLLGTPKRMAEPYPNGSALGIWVGDHYAQLPNGIMVVKPTIVQNFVTVINLDYSAVSGTVYTAVAYSDGACGLANCPPVTITVTFPKDGSSVIAVAVTRGAVSGGVPSTYGGGGTASVLRRSCLSAPTSRYCRAEDITAGTPPKPAGIGFWRAGYPVPKLMLNAIGVPTLWEIAGVPVTSLATDTSPSLAADIRGQLYCAFARQGAGAFVKRSDDMGSTWGVEVFMIPGGQLPAIATANGAMLAAAITGTAQSGYSLMTAYKAAGDRVFSVPVIAKYAPPPVASPPIYSPFVPQLSGIALCQAAEGPGRWILSVLLKGEAATSEWYSADSGISWTRIPTA